MSTIMVTRNGLLLVPSESMPARTRNPGKPSMKTSPTAATGDGTSANSPASTSVSPRANPALTTPAMPARRRRSTSSITNVPR